MYVLTLKDIHNTCLILNCGYKQYIYMYIYAQKNSKIQTNIQKKNWTSELQDSRSFIFVTLPETYRFFSMNKYNFCNQKKSYKGCDPIFTLNPCTHTHTQLLFS